MRVTSDHAHVQELNNSREPHSYCRVHEQNLLIEMFENWRHGKGRVFGICLSVPEPYFIPGDAHVTTHIDRRDPVD